MEALVDLFARIVLEGGSARLWIAPTAFVIGVPCALALHRRGKLFWIVTALMLAAVLFIGVGLIQPMLFISGLAIAVLMLSMLLIVVVPIGVVVLLVGTRPERLLEAVYALCSAATVFAAATLVTFASASV